MENMEYFEMFGCECEVYYTYYKKANVFLLLASHIASGNWNYYTHVRQCDLHMGYDCRPNIFILIALHDKK